MRHARPTLVATALSAAATVAVGRTIDTPTALAAIAAGGIGGAIAGFVPPEFLATALGAYILLATCGGSVLAAVCADAGWYRAERGQPTG